MTNSVRDFRFWKQARRKKGSLKNQMEQQREHSYDKDDHIMSVATSRSQAELYV